MNILVNGIKQQVSHAKLAQVLTELGYHNQIIVTAVNGEFVSEADRMHFFVQQSDCLEVLSPVQGG